MDVDEPAEAAIQDAADISGVLRQFTGNAEQTVYPTEGNVHVDIQSGCPELDCVRELLSPDVIDAAERRSARVDIGADRVLVTAGLIDEETYVCRLGAQLGIGFDSLDGTPRALCPLADRQLAQAATHGLLPVMIKNELVLVIAPRAVTARRLATSLPHDHPLTRRLRFTTAMRLNEFVLRHGGHAIAASATDALKEAHPALSACTTRRRWAKTLIVGGAIALMAITGAVLMPATGWRVLAAIQAILFLSWLSLRFAAAFVRAPAEPPIPGQSDEALPVYSIIAALYDEAASVGGLLDALEQINYPPEKLDLILALEEDDHATRAAVAARNHRIPITIVTVPAIGPRTKPKALNMALPFARGLLTVIYDAEDRPEPDQLRRALHAFRTGDDDLACVQARLCIDNTEDGWLARLFTAEYAGQFDVFLPGISVLSLPLPLGGSSNHFRTSILRAIGGWDSYNVTEDADIGIRLARFGYRASMIDSTTYEEAPVCVGPWLRQRTRWFKGWIQTWLVHMRQPHLLIRELGWAGFLGFQLYVGGNALAALVHPFFLGALVATPITGISLWAGDTTFGTALSALCIAAATAGYLVSGFVSWLGLQRRGLQQTAWVLLLIPVHWVLLSLAAWRALYQLVVAPHLWEKTPHGFAKSSRRTCPEP
ncbi:MAG TPA: glycosyltransferase family 2 protein [Pseudolabrys sp.]|nr:glycosyltransferase family 2 protein [Pseudolabrys sp.]